MSNDAIFPYSEDDAQQAAVLEQYHQLGCAILCRAIEQWKQFKDPDYERTQDAFDFAVQRGYLSVRGELSDFFWSKWCLVLCQEAGLEYEDTMKRIGMPRLSPF